MDYTQQKVSVKEAKQILFDCYNIKGTVSELAGEVDYNFRIKADDSQEYILKISRPNETVNHLIFQQKLLQHLQKKSSNIVAPKVVLDRDGNEISTITDQYKNNRNVRLITWISGKVYSSVNPQLNDLRYSLGKKCGILTAALQDFHHSASKREFDWDIAQSLWTKKYIHLFEKEEEKEIIRYFQHQFEQHFSSYTTLRKSIVHNDANDHNVIVSEKLINPEVLAVIDYGDAIHTQIINDLAVACSYAIMHQNNPLAAALPIVKGYHSEFALEEKELEFLYHLIAMRLVISVTKSAIGKINEPDNSYLSISEKPAWELLKKWRTISSEFALYSFRNVCGFLAHPNEKKFSQWVSNNQFSINDVFPSISKSTIFPLDLSVSSTWVGHKEEFNDLDFFQYKINSLEKEHPNKIIAGGYLEPRALYTSSDYDAIGNNGKKSRTTHLGVDFWLPKNTPVHALLDGEIHTSTFCEGSKNYGGLIILKHQINDFQFYTLYGHLSLKSIKEKSSR